MAKRRTRRLVRKLKGASSAGTRRVRPGTRAVAEEAPYGTPPAAPVAASEETPAQGHWKAPGELVRDKRKELREAGVKGPERRQQIKAYRKEARELSKEDARSRIPENARPYIRNPVQFQRKLRKRGIVPRMGEEMTHRQMYGADERDALKGHFLDSLPAPGEAPKVPLHHGEQPVYGAFQTRIKEAIESGRGLTPAEEAMYRRTGAASVQGGVNTMLSSAGSRGAAAGIDPRSGVAGQRAMQIQQARMRGMTGVENNIVAQDLARKRDYESYASGFSGLEEGGRRFDVGAEQDRLAHVEGGLSSLAGLNERSYEFDRDLVEGRKQSALARKDLKEAAEAAEPTTLQQVGAGFGGLSQGLSSV